LGLAGGEGVLVEREERLDAIHEAGGEVAVVEGEGAAHEAGQLGGVQGVGTGAGVLVELGQQRLRFLAVAVGELELGGGRQRNRYPL
jgi:hypothetical protein